MPKFTQAQLVMLRMLSAAPVCSGKRDVCLNALKRRGLVAFNSGLGRKYGRDTWHLTDAGREVVKTLW